METSRILQWIEILKSKPKMLISENEIDYKILKTYVEGYIDGLDMLFEIGLMRKITYWFHSKVKETASVFWVNHIPLYYSNKTDKELQNILLETIEEFFNENPEWNIE
jgi:hypothetical protein